VQAILKISEDNNYKPLNRGEIETIAIRQKISRRCFS